MSRELKPSKKHLPPAQQRLWPALKPAAELGYVLYGGTAIALRLGHRVSVDFDFFTERPLDRTAIEAAFQFMRQAIVLQDRQNTLSVLVPCDGPEGEQIKISFFGGIEFGRCGQPDTTEDGVVQLASMDDLMATKTKVILQRVDAKDYRDIVAMIDAGVSLEKGLAAARKMFGVSFQPSESLKAMVYFEGGDLHDLAAEEKEKIVRAVSSVHQLPDAPTLVRQLTRCE